MISQLVSTSFTVPFTPDDWIRTEIVSIVEKDSGVPPLVVVQVGDDTEVNEHEKLVAARFLITVTVHVSPALGRAATLTVKLVTLMFGRGTATFIGACAWVSAFWGSLADQ